MISKCKGTGINPEGNLPRKYLKPVKTDDLKKLAYGSIILTGLAAGGYFAYREGYLDPLIAGVSNVVSSINPYTLGSEAAENVISTSTYALP